MATTSIPTTCAAVTNAFLRNTEHLTDGVDRIIKRKHPIVRLQSKKRGQWQKGHGASHSVIDWERTFPNLTTDGWTTIAASDGDTANACRPVTETVAFGQTARTFTPKHYAVNTEHFCIRDIEQDWQFEDLFTKVTRSLANVSEWIWYLRETRDYVANVGRYITVKADGLHESTSGYDVSYPPNAPLNQSVLDSLYMDQYREGGDSPSGFDEATEAPVFSVILSPEDSNQILKGYGTSATDARLNNARYAFMGKGDMSPLSPGIGTKRQHWGNWVHEIEAFPRHFNLTGGVYVEVAPFVQSATTKGYKWEQNDAYKYAAFREIIVWHEDVVQSLAAPTGNISGGNFNPHTWRGDFSPRNILHETCNPDGTEIFFRALYAQAAKPLNPSLGIAILVANCQPPLDLANGCYA